MKTNNTKVQITRTIATVMAFCVLGFSLVSCGNKKESSSTGNLSSSIDTAYEDNGTATKEESENDKTTTYEKETNTKENPTSESQGYETSGTLDSEGSTPGNVEVGPNMIKASIERANGEEIVLEGGKLNSSQTPSTINTSETETNSNSEGSETEGNDSTERIPTTEEPIEDNYTPSISVIKTFWMDMSKGQDYVFNGEFLVLNFKVKETTPDGAYEININKIDMSNYAAQMIKANTSGGYIYVGNTTEIPADDINMNSFIIYAPENKNVQQGDSVQFTFNIENNPGIMAFILSIAFDESALDFESIEVGDAAKGIISIG